MKIENDKKTHIYDKCANGRKNIYVSAFDPILGLGELEDITDQKELDMVRDVLKEIDESSK